MEKDFIFKNRSFSSCLLAAYTLVGENMKGILRSTWLPVLLCGIFSGVFITTNIRLPEVQKFSDSHPALFLTIYGISLIGMIACSIWAYSRLFSMLNGQSRRWNLVRMLKLWLCCVIIGIIIGVILAGGALLAARHLKVDLLPFIVDNWLVVLCTCIVGVIALLPFNYVSMRYIISPEARFFPDLPKSYSIGFRHIGFIFITTLITLLILSIIGTIICLPFIILVVAQTFSAVGVANGDPSGMPGYFATLHGITYGVTIMLMIYLAMFQMIVYMFMYGSIEKQREERRNTKLPTPADESISLPPTNPLTHDNALPDYSI